MPDNNDHIQLSPGMRVLKLYAIQPEKKAKFLGEYMKVIREWMTKNYGDKKVECWTVDNEGTLILVVSLESATGPGWNGGGGIPDFNNYLSGNHLLTIEPRPEIKNPPVP